MTHPHAQLAAQAYAAFGSGDMQVLDRLIADDVQWHISGDSAISGTYKGKQEVFGFFGKLAEISQGTFSLDVHDIVASDDHTVVLTRATGERDGLQHDTMDVHVIHLSDDQITSFWSFNWDQAESREFWG